MRARAFRTIITIDSSSSGRASYPARQRVHTGVVTPAANPIVVLARLDRTPPPAAAPRDCYDRIPVDLCAVLVLCALLFSAVRCAIIGARPNVAGAVCVTRSFSRRRVHRAGGREVNGDPCSLVHRKSVYITSSACSGRSRRVCRLTFPDILETLNNAFL